MPSQPPIPPLLLTEFCISQPKGSLILLTSVLNASANWVLLRHVYAAVKIEPSPSSEHVGGMAGFNLLDHGKITFIDALQSGLGLRKNGIREVEDMLLKKIKEIETSNNKILLVLDGIDLLLSATEARLDEVLGMIWELREHVHTSILSMSTDCPLLLARHTSLETDDAAFLMSLAHQARAIWAVKGLDTGTARDVSGVLRISRGPATEDDDHSAGARQEEKECLFSVAADGGVRVNQPYAKGTSSFGKRHNKTHTLCRRCGRRSLHIQKHTCSSCGYPAAKIRQYNWGMKAKRRKTTGTGRMRTLKEVPRKFKNGFQTGTPKGARGPANQ
ncbi:MAG: hypothetical protein Q9202_005656 [Teloschistes flavicans]